MQLDLDGRIERIEQALASEHSPWSAAETAAARADIAAIQARRAIADGHVVAALVGGTGSGKSSLFNALTGTDFADAGALRPTTEAATAFSWGRPAERLLAYLGVDAARITSRTADLERAHEKPLEQLVLLDLPDHDSVKDAHGDLVDRLLPLVDVLVWVVDPQKYADHILHSRYLAKMRRRADAMVVVLNHADRVPASGRQALLRDIREVLTLDGLPDVKVLTSSAATGEGVDELRRFLAKANAQPSIVERTASAELDAVVARLHGQLAAEEPGVTEDLVEQTSSELVTACGVDAVVDALGRALLRPRDASVPPAQSPSYPTVAAVGSTWMMRAQDDLPTVWEERIDDATPGVQELADAVHAVVRAVPRPPLTDSLGKALRIGGSVMLVAAVVLGVLAFALDPTSIYVIAAAVSACIGTGLWVAADFRRKARARRLPQEYAAEVHRAVMGVVRERLVDPTIEVLAQHEELRSLLRS
ncbi:MAG: 50S ribosome-binding GTPase [Bowdeniella nasicola]|nr:50S ribosome-binding GTPase [Bowdeniella nasicola]